MVVCPQLLFAVLITILDKTSLSEEINEYYTVTYGNIVTDLNDILLEKNEEIKEIVRDRQKYLFLKIHTYCSFEIVNIIRFSMNCEILFSIHSTYILTKKSGYSHLS